MEYLMAPGLVQTLHQNTAVSSVDRTVYLLGYRVFIRKTYKKSQRKFQREVDYMDHEMDDLMDHGLVAAYPVSAA